MTRAGSMASPSNPGGYWLTGDRKDARGCRCRHKHGPGRWEIFPGVAPTATNRAASVSNTFITSVRYFSFAATLSASDNKFQQRFFPTWEADTWRCIAGCAGLAGFPPWLGRFPGWCPASCPRLPRPRWPGLALAPSTRDGAGRGHNPPENPSPFIQRMMKPGLDCRRK